jgi:uncharacterized phage-associated protein
VVVSKPPGAALVQDMTKKQSECHERITQRLLDHFHGIATFPRTEHPNPMAVSALSAARTLCELRKWNVSNLELQKILYLAHMFYLGRNGAPLLNEDFEAWDYGPVIPELYHRAKAFGSGPVRNVFHWVPPVPPGTTEYEVLREAVEATRAMRAGQLVAITHWDRGAWAQVYRPGLRGVKIPNHAIAGEYRDRVPADS